MEPRSRTNGSRFLELSVAAFKRAREPCEGEAMRSLRCPFQVQRRRVESCERAGHGVEREAKGEPSEEVIIIMNHYLWKKEPLREAYEYDHIHGHANANEGAE